MMFFKMYRPHRSMSNDGMMLGHSASDQPMVCESPLRFRLNLAHVQIMPKKSMQIFSDVGQAVSEI